MLNIEKDKDKILKEFPQLQEDFAELSKLPSCRNCQQRRQMRLIVGKLRHELDKPDNAHLRTQFLSNESPTLLSPEVHERESCLFCFEKHLSKALVLLKEVEAGYTPDKGYPHLWLALGNLSEAEDEIMREDKNLATRVRILRRQITKEIEVDETTD